MILLFYAETNFLKYQIIINEKNLIFMILSNRNQSLNKEREKINFYECAKQININCDRMFIFTTDVCSKLLNSD